MILAEIFGGGFQGCGHGESSIGPGVPQIGDRLLADLHPVQPPPLTRPGDGGREPRPILRVEEALPSATARAKLAPWSVSTSA